MGIVQILSLVLVVFLDMGTIIFATQNSEWWYQVSHKANFAVMNICGLNISSVIVILLLLYSTHSSRTEPSEKSWTNNWKIWTMFVRLTIEKQKKWFLKTQHKIFEMKKLVRPNSFDGDPQNCFFLISWPLRYLVSL